MNSSIEGPRKRANMYEQNPGNTKYCSTTYKKDRTRGESREFFWSASRKTPIPLYKSGKEKVTNQYSSSESTIRDYLASKAEQYKTYEKPSSNSHRIVLSDKEDILLKVTKMPETKIIQ